MKLITVFVFVCLVNYSICQNTTSSSNTVDKDWLRDNKQNNTTTVAPSTEAEAENPDGDTNVKNQAVTVRPSSVEVTTSNQNTPTSIVSTITNQNTPTSTTANQNTPTSIASTTESVEVIATTPVNTVTVKEAPTTVANNEDVSTSIQESVREVYC